jgi:hypothetical protein
MTCQIYLGGIKMPATSKAQLTAMRIAQAAKRGKIPESKLRGASKQMAAGMTDEQLSHFTKTKKSGLPERVAKESITRMPNVMFGFGFKK